jgi:hypothetical protein
MGLWTNVDQLSVYISDALLGILPDVLLGHASLRPHYMVQWLPLSVGGLFWLGMLALIKHRSYLMLIVASALVIAPRWLTVSAAFESGYEIFDVRYFLAASYFQIMLAGLGLAVLVSFLRKRKFGKWIAPTALVLILLNIMIGAPRAYAFRFTYQEEYQFLSEMLQTIPDGSDLYLFDPYSNGWSNNDISLHVSSSLALLNKPNIHVKYMTRIQHEWRPDRPSYYFELAACRLPIDWIFDRRQYIPAPATKPYISDGRIGPSMLTDSPDLVDAIGRQNILYYTSSCQRIRQSSALERLETRRIRLKDFSSMVSIFPGWVSIGFYKINPELNANEMKELLSRSAERL